ncbi:hypothetical protein SAY87_027207 [Trapa incisa]|uniref:WD repeat-containing protein 6 n=1 Tax=Trapa incisa TaxID=236973 RepID=A0AAN7GT01_9MYRT|nr:hypothetical protein SAY87_027207 [Trapa incisa]
MTEVVPPPNKWRLRGGQYLGEISALCFLRLPPLSSVSCLPLLLSGSGSQVFVHSIESGELIRSFHVFEGIRVHGITCCSVSSTEGLNGSTFAYSVAVYGERRVKLFTLTVQVEGKPREEKSVSLELRLLHALPKLGHWVLDVCFLKNEASSVDESNLVAVGCSDNSVTLWDPTHSTIILQVSSPDRSLLYSMRLWGNNLEDLRIASGTIYNEIIVWRVVPSADALFLSSPMGESISRHGQQDYRPYEAIHMCRLVGHEGSIFRIAWSSDGSKLVSVSDDRSARVWKVHSDAEYSDNIGHISFLFGHNARVWDCVISNNVIITASEDCSCRIWGIDGKQLKVIKEHVGRGIWRCLFDTNSFILITGGFDSEIKVHQLKSLLAQDPDQSFVANAVPNETEHFSIRVHNSSESLGLMDSKSEYVRGLRFSSEDSIYVSTNHGYLYHAKLSKCCNVSWTKLARVNPEVPIVCMDLISKSPSKIPDEIEDWIAVGDGKGCATVIKVVTHAGSPKVEFSFSWTAEMDRQLLGIYFCRSLGHRFIFTADPRGVIKLWRLDTTMISIPYDNGEYSHASFLAEFVSHLGVRIICLDALPREEVLICGDLRGCLLIFPFLRDQLMNETVKSKMKISPMNHFKGAHGISTVSSITVSGCSPNHIDICSTGADGCICYLEYDKELQIVKFVGMKQVKELSLIESIDNKSSNDIDSCNYAAGFASADFIIWNLATETKVLQIPCGGWRRPHSYYLGNVPDMKNCFAYVKDEIIHIYRLWKSETGERRLPCNLHMQFHGRELHSLCFVSQNPQVEANKRPSWILTGCEDGTVRLTRYDPYIENWSSSKLLGEHVGGSAVRSICCVSKTHIVNASGGGYAKNVIKNLPASTEAGDVVLLISVGAKRVLTSWLLRDQIPHSKFVDDLKQKQIDNSTIKSSSISFQWLSTDMPIRNSVPLEISQKRDSYIKGSKSASDEEIDTRRKLPSDGNPRDKYEDDWRYLAVTAFLAKCAGSRLTVCFTAVACSDATLTVRALVLPYCLWFDVAMLVPVSSPVLSLQHIIVPMVPLQGEETPLRNIYILISGATDGSIVFWDLTGSVKAFMEHLSTLHLENLIDCQKRPRTGRGSQGGRWWRSLNSRFPKKHVDAKSQEKSKVNKLCGAPSSFDDSNGHARSSSQDMENGSPRLEKSSVDNSALEISEIYPLSVLHSIHQSGVNCLHVSEGKPHQITDGHFMYHLVSGGDDQALHCLTWEVLPQSLTDDPDEKKKTKCVIKFMYRDRIASGHSSAVKGVWTDGTLVFSTGLDQRVRCWILGETGKLTEHSHLIVSVPEPEALDARACSWGRYQIVVAGRGMQMIEFLAENCSSR